jgi:hypothetical protein
MAITKSECKEQEKTSLSVQRFTFWTSWVNIDLPKPPLITIYIILRFKKESDHLVCFN